MTDEHPPPGMSDWLKVMLEEIDRRKHAADEARLERQRRSQASGESRDPGAAKNSG